MNDHGNTLIRTGGDDPVDPETVFQIASVSKSITGTAIAKAVSACPGSSSALM